MHHPGFLMTLMLLCVLSRGLCPLMQGPVRHWTISTFAMRVIPARLLTTPPGRLHLTESQTQPALLSPMEDGSVPSADPVVAMQPLPQTSPLPLASRPLPVGESPTYSPLRI